MQNQSQYEEINLADYVKVVFKRKKLILLIFILAIMSAFVFSVLSPKIYKIDSSLQIGRIGQDLIEAPTQLVAKLNNQVYNGKYEIGVKAESPANTQLVRMKIESADFNKAKSALEEINNLILQEHQIKTENQKKLIQKDIEQLESKIRLVDEEIKSSQNKIILVNNNIEKTQNKIKPIQNDIQRIKDKISHAREEQKALEDKVESLEKILVYEQDPGTQFALFDTKEKLGNKKQEIENLYLSINSLTRTIEDYNIEINNLASSKEDYFIKINTLRADKDDLELEINALNKSLQDIEPTKIVKQPTLSKFPIKPRPILNMAIAGVLGLFIGIFLAFAREYWQKNL